MLCRKCNSEGSLAIRKVYFYCENCFIATIIHKFRSCIGKNTKLKLTDKVLICLSGGISSTVLMDLVMNGISLNSHKKLQITPIFLHVTGFDEHSEAITKSISHHCKIKHLDFHIVNVSQFTSVENNDRNIFEIQHPFNKLSQTTRIDYISKMKQQIFYKVAKEFECNLIFSAETNTKLSEKLLTNLVTGRGSQIENDVGFCDDRHNDIKVLRPMREITKEELDHYVRIKELNPYNSNNVQELNSLQSIISKFVCDLQENTPATISTICKTAEKIGSEEGNETKKYCIACQNRIDVQSAKLTAVSAIAYSKKVSSALKNESIQLEDDLSVSSVFPHIYDSLCYGCSKNYCEIKMEA
ncbi:cytoplasmic tRNA 2-thiolation protein 2-B [Zerene cesonia]|uniref:cytoplasmic tRNA 2-thiolation protein 2-B n=1 Tax=Zerene cesonia TaxID=33412 RepID=UPI0018E5A543|nr:cytoplasmic tRNA 2-thiolation protein 2-B [Zerene cesonia]